MSERVLSPRATLRRAVGRPGQAHAVRPRPWRWALPALLLLVPFALWPLLALLREALTPAGTLSLGALGEVLSNEGYRDRLVFSLAQAAVATALAVLLGLPVAWALARAQFRGHRAFRGLMLLPFLLPPVAAALAFRELLGTERAASAWAIVLTHGWMGMGAVAAITSVAWARLDPRTADSARLLGAPRWRAFVEVTLPALAPSLAAAGALAFTLALTSFGAVLLLAGGDTALDTAEVAAFRLAAVEELSADVAAMSLLQLPLTLIALWVYVSTRWPSMPERGPLPSDAAGRDAPGLGPREPGAMRAGSVRLWVVVVAGAVVVVAPLAWLLLGALTEGRDGLSFENFSVLFGGESGIALGDAAAWSAAYALGGVAIALVAGSAAVFAVARWPGRARRWSAGALLLPATLPAVLLALAYGEGFDDGRWVVFIAHAVIVYPFVVRPLLAARLATSRATEEAPRMLRASAAQAWRHAELPGLRRAMMVGAVFAAAISLGETGATVLLAGTDGAEGGTLAVAVIDAFGTGGMGDDRGAAGPAMALAALLAGLVAVAVVAVEAMAGTDAGRDAGEF